MTADIWDGIMKATRPWTWFPHHEVGFFNHLHYQSEPVPGIYLVTSEGRYLVAIRPNGNKRGCRELFKQYAQHIALDEHETERYAEQEQQGRTDWSLNETGTKRTSSQVCTAESIRTTVSAGGDESVTILDVRRVRFQLPVRQPRPDPYNPSAKVYRKSPLRKCQRARNERENQPQAHSNGLRSYLRGIHQNRCSNDCPLRSIDIVGFRYLQNPLQVEYSPYLERWIFTLELRKRTAVVDVCPYAWCGHQGDSACNQTKVPKQFTCLDDGRTWLLTGDLDKHGKVKQRKQVIRDNSPLYALSNRDIMTQLDPKRSLQRMGLLEYLEGTFLKWTDMPKEYTVALNYIGVWEWSTALGAFRY